MRALDPRLLRHAASARRFVALAVVIAVGTAVLVMVQAQLLAGVIDRAFLGGAGLGELYPLLAVLVAAVIGRAALAWGSEVAAHRASTDVIRELRTKLVDHILRLGPRHRDVAATSAQATLASRGLDGLDGYFSRYLPTLLIAAIVPAVIAGRILFADWVSGLIIALTMPLIPLFMVLIGMQTDRSTKRQWRKLAVLGHHFLDVVAGLDTLVAFGRAGRQRERLRAIAESYRTATMRTLRVAFLSALTLELVATLSVALVAVAIGLRLVDGQLDLATGLLVLVLAPEVYLPLRAVGARFHESAEGLAAAGEMFAVLDTPVGAGPVAGGGTATGAGPVGGEPVPDPSRVPVRVRGVTVSGRSGRVLDELDLTIGPGEVVGVRGPSGAGKSTLIDVLLGFRAPDSGAVEVGATILAELDRAAWLNGVAWVPQRPVLLAGTVADNIRLGAVHADWAQVRRAASVAALDVPLDTAVGEGGAGLSTGQQRRVALARAVLADRPLLLLDEPTEGVDAATEAVILAGLREVFAGRTVVVVSHHDAVLACCDRVVELAAGPAQPAPDAIHPAPGPDQPELPDRPDEPPESGDPAGPPAHAAGPPAKTGRALRWVLSAARGHRARLGLAVLLGSAALGCGVALTATSAWLISAAALQPPVLTLAVAIAAVRAFGLGKGVLRYTERLVSHDAALRVLIALRLRIWQAVVRLGPAVTARLRRGELLSRLIGDVEAQQDVLVRVLIPYACAALVGAVVSLGLGLLLPVAGLVVALGLLVAGVVAPAIAVLAARAAERRTAAARGTVTAAAVELLGAAPDLIAFGAAERYRHALADADARLSRLLGRSATARGLGSGLTVAAIGCTAVAATALGVAALRAGSLPGTALAVLALTPLAAAELVAGLPDAALRLAGAAPAARRLAELETMPSPVAEPARPAGVPPPRELATRDLAVRWPRSASDAVSGVALTLGAGTRLALTGPSGSGKSTVVAALMRTLDPSCGAVLADGRDARELAGDELRRGIAWCGPWTHLFDSTLRANLLLARPDAADHELAAALRRARLGGWLAGLPRGLDTLVGRHGGAVSGGERQRIGIARALLADRPVLLLDEPTAHLDAGTAAALSGELLDATAGRTALIVTHRLDQFHGLVEVHLTPNGQGAAS